VAVPLHPSEFGNGPGWWTSFFACPGGPAASEIRTPTRTAGLPSLLFPVHNALQPFRQPHGFRARPAACYPGRRRPPPPTPPPPQLSPGVPPGLAGGGCMRMKWSCRTFASSQVRLLDHAGEIGLPATPWLTRLVLTTGRFMNCQFGFGRKAVQSAWEQPHARCARGCARLMHEGGGWWCGPSCVISLPYLSDLVRLGWR
jgi:hypothetical protein